MSEHIEGSDLAVIGMAGRFPGVPNLEVFWQNLRDGVESVSGEQLRLKLISPLRPAVLQGDDDDFLYLIMPIRLAG